MLPTLGIVDVAGIARAAAGRAAAGQVAQRHVSVTLCDRDVDHVCYLIVIKLEVVNGMTSCHLKDS